MKQSGFNLILAILAFVTLIIPFTGKVHDGRNARRNLIRGFTKRGWILIITVFIGVIVTYLKENQAENDDIAKENAVKAQKKRDDLLANIRTDNSNAKIVSAFTTSLAKYGLKYDSSEKAIQKLIRDSIKNKIQPNISFSDIILLNPGTDSNKLQINITCKFAPAYKINMKTEMAVNLDDILYKTDFINDSFKMKNGTIQADKRLTFEVRLKQLPKDVRFLYFYLFGTYQDALSTKHILSDLVLYDIQASRIGLPSHPNFEKILKFVKSNKSTKLSLR